jgi:hypothetical protein
MILKMNPINPRQEKTINSFISFFLTNLGISNAKMMTKMMKINKYLDIYIKPSLTK